MSASLKQLLAVSALLSAAEKVVAAGKVSAADSRNMRAAIEIVRSNFADAGFGMSRREVMNSGQVKH